MPKKNQKNHNSQENVQGSQESKEGEQNSDGHTSELRDKGQTNTGNNEAEALVLALQNPLVIKAFENMLVPTINRSVNAALAPVKEKVDALELDNNLKHDEYKVKFEKIMKDHNDLQQKFKQMDRSSRICNLKIYGIPLKSTDNMSKQDSYSDSIMEIVEEAGIDGIKKEDFNTISRITPSGQPSFLLVKMNTYKQKMKLYTQRTKLKNCSARIYINEDLTKEEGILHKKSRKDVKEGTLHSCWTMGGLVYGKTSSEGKPFQIKEI
jgi:hypothetical protein